MRIRIALRGLAAWLAVASAALACPVCCDTGDGVVLRTYAISTTFLSVLPFAVVGGLAFAAWHLRRQALQTGEPAVDG